MNTRTLTTRVQPLEARLPPPKEPLFMTIEFVAPGGEITREVVIQLGLSSQRTP